MIEKIAPTRINSDELMLISQEYRSEVRSESINEANGISNAIIAQTTHNVSRFESISL